MKVLGLDLGTNSIGWAVVDKENEKIIDTGVRIFPEGVEVDTIGKGEKEISKNATRRENRQKRRQFYRKRMRKIKLLELLIEQGMCPLTKEELGKWKNWDRSKKSEGRLFPQNPEFLSWIRMNPYLLRRKALNEKISLYELGRIFYHFIQRRGFLSNRKSKEESKIFTKGKPEENILPINETREKIEDSTLGAYLSHIYPEEGSSYTKISDEDGRIMRIRGRYTVRDMYIAEFNSIWKKQAGYHALDSRSVRLKKIRELKGSLEGKRNKAKINNLKNKFGENNIDVCEPDQSGNSKVISYEKMSLKKALGGEIIVETVNGESDLRFNSDQSIIFWQRPLRSQKGTIGNCRFEDEIPVITANGEFLLNAKGEIQRRSKKPCPLSHPDFELFRAYQLINNIKYGKNQKLTDSQREQVLDLINRNESNFDFKKIPQDLKMTYEKFNYPDDMKVAGNYTMKKVKPLFADETWEEHSENIWHCFYFYEDNEKLFEKLRDDYGYDGDIDTISKIKLKDGYASVSLKAIRNILPFLKKGYTYDQCVILGGVKNAFGKRWNYFMEFHEEIEDSVVSILKEDNKEGEAIEKVKEYLSDPLNDFGFATNDPWFTHLYHHSATIEKARQKHEKLPPVENLRNPIVQQGLNETRRLVNTLLEKYRDEFGKDFRFDRIHVEMGRDLRNSKMQRQEMSRRISENENKNDEARMRLAEFGLQPSRVNIQKYLMFKEIDDRASGPVLCPYTGKIIKLSDLFGMDNTVQIEHIIPYSVSLDDSFANKTLCEANFNRDKGEKTPYQFYCENPNHLFWGISKHDTLESGWNEIVERAFRILPYRKAKRFTTKKAFEKSDFIERQLNDSRYIAKKAVELLSHICDDVRVMPGSLTAELRHLWGLNNILQPEMEVDLNNIDFSENSSLPGWVVMDEYDNPIRFMPKQNRKPHTDDDEILITGFVKKEKFSTKYFDLTIETPGLDDGRYWAKFKVAGDIGMVPKYIDKPVTNQDFLVMKGRVEKGVFSNDTMGRVKCDSEDGNFWAKLPLLKINFEEPKRDSQPKKGKNKVVLFGNVKNGVFQSYIYECDSDLPDGKYWVILDYDPYHIEFIRAENPEPDIDTDQFVITATVDEEGVMVADGAKEFRISTTEKPGKYYTVLTLSSHVPELKKIENDPPGLSEGQKLLEGTVWVDKYTGEIKFDPKKSRNDHRHHAIDAITIALTEQGFLQRLSTYNAQRKEKQRQQIDSTEKFPEPWPDFRKDAQNAVTGILVSHRKKETALTKNKKGFSVRGQLHKDNVYGRRCAPGAEEGYHRRVKITELKTQKHVGKVVDAGIRKLIEAHLERECGINVRDPKGYSIPNDAFVREGEWRLFLPNRNGDPVPVKKVRLREVMGNATRLKSNLNQWVNPRNNHHVMIYKDREGNLREDVVQFWTVVERILQGADIYKLPEDGEEIVTTLEINDMFLLGLSDEEFERNRNDRQFLSKCLYRVQKISSSYYNFRLHTASTLDNKNEEIYIVSFKAWERYNPKKIELDSVGNFKIMT